MNRFRLKAVRKAALSATPVPIRPAEKPETMAPPKTMGFLIGKLYPGRRRPDTKKMIRKALRSIPMMF